MELKAITVSNFRSIRGSLTIPLDAPVVLIHGLNGAGKTSVLAALELALTGQFAGTVPAQPGILVHHGAAQQPSNSRPATERPPATCRARGSNSRPS